MEQGSSNEAGQVARGSRHGKARLALVLGLAVIICGAAANGFHSAATPAEQGLDRILRIADADDYLLDNLLAREPAPRSKRVDYSRLLSRPLIDRLRQEERAMVRENCGGRYRSDEPCGFEFIPVTCSQDSAPSHEFQTLRQDGEVTIIRFRYGGAEPNWINTYRLIRDGDGWKIDDILCPEEKASFRKLISP